MELRATTVEDLPALHGLFEASIAGVYRPHGFASPAPPLAVFENQHRHILGTGGTSVVAWRGDELVGFASSWVRGDDWFLASLFVSPNAQAAGIGHALLDAVWGDAHLRRRTITDAIQPVSNALYGRRGLIAATPVLDFSGRSSVGGREPVLARQSGDALSVSLAAIDAAAYGFDRSVDHAYWRELAQLTVWAREGEAVAYSYVWPGGPIGPVAGLDAAAAAAALECELDRADGPVAVRIPGASRSLAGVALRRGLRLSPTPGLLLASDGVRSPESLAIGSYTLF